MSQKLRTSSGRTPQAVKPKIRTAALISGRGSNMEALAKAASADDYPAKIVTVISNRPDAGGLQRAENLGIRARVIDHTAFSARRDFEKQLDQALREMDVELIALAGFMRVLSPWFVKRWRGRIINIHPSLLPKYKGLDTHERALAAGDKLHGCTVHFVNEELDGGDIIAQASLKIRPGDTGDCLAKRLIPLEHKLYVQALEQVSRQLR